MAKEKIFSVTIKDCIVQTFRAGGKGGQNQNKRDTGVRIVHPASGAVGEARDARGQFENKKRAFVRMAESSRFQSWAKREALGLHQIVSRRVDQMMKEVEIEYSRVAERVDALDSNSSELIAHEGSTPFSAT